MELKKQFEPDEEMINKIISVAYGDAGIWERMIVYKEARHHKEVEELLEKYRTTAREVHQIDEEEFPEEMLHRGKTANLPTEKLRSNFLGDLFYIILAKPAAAGAATIILLATIVTAVVMNRPVEYKYSESEIRLADKQAKYALALVGKIFKDTKITVSQEVLNDKIGKPIRESLGIVNKLFNEEGEIQ